MTPARFAPERRAHRGALAALSLGTLLSSLGTSIANVALPTLAQAFGASFHAVQWVALAYLLSVTSLIVTVGRLGDLIGRHRLLLAGVGLFTAASLASAAAPTLSVLIAGRAVQGMGAAIMMALALAVLAEAVPKARVGGAMGLLGTMSAIGTALGPSLGGLLVWGLGWRSIFLVNLPLGAATFALAYVSLAADGPAPARERAHFDAAGTILLSATLIAYALATTVGHGSFGLLNIAALVAALSGAVGFVLVEMRVASPLVRFAIFQQPAIAAGVLTSLVVATVMMATLVVGPFYLSRALGLDAALTGLVMTAGPLVAALAGIPAGRAVDRLGAEPMASAGLAAIAAGAVLLSVLPIRLGVGGYLAPLVVTTAGYALFQAANNTAVMRDIAGDQRGLVSGLINLARNLGLITGAAVLGAIFAAASGTADLIAASPKAVAGGMRVTFAVAAGLIVAAFFAVRAVRRLVPGAPESVSASREAGLHA